jgi:SAM-dependent methyltransferase
MPPRVLQPEILDALAPDHPDAQHSRRDLRITNRIMGNYRWLGRVLVPLLKPGERALEIGAGTGDLCLRLAKAGIAADGLDLWPRPAVLPADRAWHVADLRRFDGFDDYAVVFGNLIFHHFNDLDLERLGARLRRSRNVRAVIACEPTRRRGSQTAFAAAGALLGANSVTLHDARVSIAAGFAGSELSQALGLAAGDWECHVRQTLLGAYRLTALRRA